MDEISIKGLLLIIALILAVILIVDFFQLRSIKKKFSPSDVEPISPSNYYELKWRINLLLSITTISAIALGTLGYSVQKDFNDQITVLHDSIIVFKGKLQKISVEINEKEERVAFINDNIESLSEENRKLHSNIKGNIGKVYKDLRGEELKQVMKELENNPEDIRRQLPFLSSFNLPKKYYKIIKKCLYSGFIPSISDSQKKDILCLLVKNYPQEIVTDFYLLNDILEADASMVNISRNFSCLSDEKLMDFVSAFMAQIYKDEGIINNQFKLEWLISNLSSTSHEKGRDLNKLPSFFYSTIKNKEDRFSIYEITRNFMTKIHENSGLKNWGYGDFELNYFELLLRYKRESRSNSESHSVLIKEIEEILKNKKTPNLLKN